MGKKKEDKMKRSLFMKGLALFGCLLVTGFFLLPVHAQARNIKVGIIDCCSGPAAV